MRHRLRTLLSLAAIFLAAAGKGEVWAQAAAASPGGAASGPYALSGTVINSVTGNPVARALVLLGGAGTRAAFTDHEGRFRFEDLPVSSAYLTVHKPGYFNAQDLGDRTPGFVQAGQLAQVGANPVPVVLALTPAASIVGRVSSLDEPIEDLPVALLSRVLTEGRWTSQVVDITTTDEEGRFRFPRLRPGRYYLRAGPSASRLGLPPSGGEREKGFPVTYYPSASESGRGEGLQLRAGQQARADLNLQEVPLYQLSGVVTGYPAGANVTVQVQDATGQDQSSISLDPATGKFFVPPLHAGRYRILCRAAGVDGSFFLYAAQPITLAADVRGLRLTLSPMVSIPVQVHVLTTHATGEVSPGPGEVVLGPQQILPGLLLRGAPTASSQEEQYGAQWRNEPDGPALVIAGVPPGSYVLRPVIAAASWYVQSMTQAGTDLAQENLVISSAGPAPIEIELRDDPGSLAVTLQSKGQPASGTVLCLPARPGPAMPPLAVNGNGRFQITGLAPGEYEVLAFDSLDGLEYANAEALEPYRSAALRVTVAPNSTASVSLEVIPRQP